MAKKLPVQKKEEKLVSLNGLTVEELLEEVQSRGYYVAKTPTARRGQTFKGDLKRWAGKKHRFGVLSCSHLGSRYQQLTHLNTFYSICARRRINTIFHCGDVVDGEKMYRGQEYEIFAHGADAQREYAVEHYPKRKGVETLVISGNHDQSFIKHAGYNVVEAVCRQREDMRFLGDDYALFVVGKLRLGIMHGRGGVAYARSYKLQKIIEQLSPEMKPNLLFLGHYHVPAHIPGYRNIEGIQMGAFQAQTPYLVAKGLFPHVSGLIVTVQEDDVGLAKVVYEWIPFYRTIKDDF